jgi:hypothetical protein
MGDTSDKKEKPGNGPSRAFACASCGGELKRTARTEGTGKEERQAPLAKCISCGREYGRDTAVYYEIFAERFTWGKDDTVLRLWLQGNLDGMDCQVSGRVRWQAEDRAEPSVRDEWFVLSEEGARLRLVEEAGEIYLYSEYSADASAYREQGGSVEFEGSPVRNPVFRKARVVYSEGRLMRKPPVGEPREWREFRRGGARFIIEKDGDSVSIYSGKRVPRNRITRVFLRDEYARQHADTAKRRKEFRRISVIYLVFAVASGALALRALMSGIPVDGIAGRETVVADNEYLAGEDRTFQNRVLYGPANLKDMKGLYRITVRIRERVQPLSLSWQSFRVLLIKEDRFGARMHALLDERSPAAMMEKREYFNEIGIQPEPVESWKFTGGLWDTGIRYRGKAWRRSRLSASKNFLLDDPDRYYLFVETRSSAPRKIEALGIELAGGVKSGRYYAAAMAVLGLLSGFYLHRARTYNELPFMFIP